MLIYDIYSRYSPSNEIITNVVLRDLDLNFQGVTFQVPIFDKVQDEKNSLLSSDNKSCICEQMAPLRMLYIMTLVYSFKVTRCEMWIFRNR